MVIRVFAGYRSNRTPRFERLLVELRPDGLFRLLRSPLLILGIARDDVFAVDASGAITQVVENGGNLCVQAVAASTVTHEDATIVRLRDMAAQLGGDLDSHDDLIVALSVPASNSPADLQVMDGLQREGVIEDWWVSSVSPLAKM
jgi:Domain of unknown function (DUF4265)